MSDIDELRKEKAKKAADKEKAKLLNADRIEQQQQYETIVDQKRRYVSRTKHSVKDDVKYGILPKEALVIEPYAQNRYTDRHNYERSYCCKRYVCISHNV